MPARGSRFCSRTPSLQSLSFPWSPGGSRIWPGERARLLARPHVDPTRVAAATKLLIERVVVLGAGSRTRYGRNELDRLGLLVRGEVLLAVRDEFFGSHRSTLLEYDDRLDVL